jgi:hypothetical protein
VQRYREGKRDVTVPELGSADRSAPDDGPSSPGVGSATETRPDARPADARPADARPADARPDEEIRPVAAPRDEAFVVTAEDAAPATLVEPKPVVPAPAAPAGRRSLRAVLADLFPDAPAVPLRRSRVALAAAAVVAGAALSLARLRGPGPFNSIFAEDATNFLSDALYHGPVDAVTKPFNGYFHIGPRLLTEVASYFPLHWVPAVMSIESALVLGLIAVLVFVASGAHLRSVPARLLVSVPVVVAASAENAAATTTNNVATLQFFAAYAVFWILLWAPASRTARAVGIVVVALTAASTMLTVVFLPLALVRLYVRRGLYDLVLAGLLVAGGALHTTALALGWTARPSFLTPTDDLGWAFDEFFRWGVPHMVFGYRWSGFPITAVNHRQLVLAEIAGVVLVLVLVAALLRRRDPVAGDRGPIWLLGGLAFAYSAAILVFQYMSSGRPEERYVITPALLLLVAVAALLHPPPHPRNRHAVPFYAYAALLAVVTAVNYVGIDSGRTLGPAWDVELGKATAWCATAPPRAIVNVDGGGGGVVKVPCRLLR